MARIKERAEAREVLKFVVKSVALYKYFQGGGRMDLRFIVEITSVNHASNLKSDRGCRDKRVDTRMSC